MEKQRKITSFLEVVIGESPDTAKIFLKATNWDVAQAIDLFFSVKRNRGNRNIKVETEEQVHPPLPELVNRREASFQDADESSSSRTTDDKLASLFRAPFALMYQGSFHEAKVAGIVQEKWLLVNLQSNEEFTSCMLNRDTWANKAVAQTISSNFIFWQINNDTYEGMKVCTFYKLDSSRFPVVLVIDPITGQKMHSWIGMVQPKRFLEDLVPFMDSNPKDYRHVPHKPSTKETSQAPPPPPPPPPTYKIQAEEEEDYYEPDEEDYYEPDEEDYDDDDDEEEEEEEEEEISMVETKKDHAKEEEEEEKVSMAENTKDDEPNSKEEEEKCSSKKNPEYPTLPEEPKGEKNLLCKVGIRFPCGRRVQRNFLRKDPIQLLWSFCYSQLQLQLEEEKDMLREFKLIQAIPGASKSLNYESNLTFEESELSNSIISLIWQ